MKKLSIGLVAVLLAVGASSFTKVFTVNAPATAYWFSQDRSNFPSDLTVNQSHLIFPTASGDENDILFQQNDPLPASFDPCEGTQTYICAVGYSDAFVDTDGKIKPAPGASVVSTIRYPN